MARYPTSVSRGQKSNYVSDIPGSPGAAEGRSGYQVKPFDAPVTTVVVSPSGGCSQLRLPRRGVFDNRCNFVRTGEHRDVA